MRLKSEPHYHLIHPRTNCTECFFPSNSHLTFSQFPISLKTLIISWIFPSKSKSKQYRCGGGDRREALKVDFFSRYESWLRIKFTSLRFHLPWWFLRDKVFALFFSWEVKKVSFCFAEATSNARFVHVMKKTAGSLLRSSISSDFTSFRSQYFPERENFPPFPFSFYWLNTSSAPNLS